MIIGKRPGIQDWNLQVVNGFLVYTVTDRTNVALIQSSAPINDGQWHRIVVEHDGSSRTLTMYIDGVQIGTPVDCGLVGNTMSADPVMLGSFVDGTDHLDFDIDTLRVTRAALAPSQFLSADYTAPLRAPLTTPPANGPTALSGLQLWLPAYDPTRYFSGDGIGDPLPIAPVTGTAAHWALDASPNQFSAYVTLPNRELLYANDPGIGANWAFPAPQGAGERLLVPNSNGTGAKNFDFVQNTGVFTLSTFVNFGSTFAGYMTLFDTADTSTVNTGFTLKVTSDGQLSLSIAGVAGANSVVRFNESTATGTIARNTWYQIAVVGNGPGNPITFYITPATNSTVMAQTSSTSITGADGNYPTDSNHNLSIGSSDILDRGFFHGQMVDQSIYNRALSPIEIQQLFNFTTQTQGGHGVGPVFLSSTNLDYGVVPYLSTPTQTLRLVNGTNDTNQGSPTNLTVLSATISGPGALHYSLQGFVPGAVIAAGAALPISVRFDGTTGSLGTYNAMLTLVTDQSAVTGSPGQTFTVPLTAGLAAAVDLNGPAVGTGYISTWTNAGPIGIVDPSLASFTDAGNTSPVSMTATLTVPHAGDVLSANTSGTNLTASYSAGTLSLTGSDSVANYTKVLRTIAYTNTNDGPGVLSETVNISANDNALNTVAAVATIIIDLVPPAIDLNGPAAGGDFVTPWTVFGPVNVGDPFSSTLTDADSTNMAWLTVTLDQPRPGDVLAVNNYGSSIAASFSGGTLSLSGVDLVANYQKLLRTITYDNTNGGPGVPSETLHVLACDGALVSTPAMVTVNIDLTPPVVDLNGAATGTGFTSTWTGAPESIVDSTSTTVLDTGTGTLLSMALAITTPATGDLLAANTTGTNITSSFNNGSLTLSGADSLAHYQQVLRTVTYTNTVSGPGVNIVKVTVIGYDGTAPSNTAVATIDVPPIVDLNGPGAGNDFSTPWTVFGPSNIANPTASTISVADNANLAWATVSLDNPQPGDVLAANTTGTNITASFDGSVLTLLGGDSVMNFQKVLRTVTYDNTDGGPGVASETLHVVASDGLLASGPSAVTVNIDLTPPIVDLNGAAAGTGFVNTWTNVPINIADAANATVVDGGSSTLQSMTLGLTAPKTGDLLVANITGTSIAATFASGTLTLTGIDTLAHYQQVLRTVTYTNTATGPGVSSVTVKVVGFDGVAPSNAAMATVGIPPVLSLTGSSSTPNYTTNWYNSGSVPIVNMAQASFVDPAGVTQLASLTVKLTTFHAGDVLSVPTLASTTITSSYANGTLTLSGVDSVSDYQRTLRFINYNNTAGGPDVPSVTATLVASDGTYSSSPVTATININVASGQVLGNRLFYNNSKYDGNNGAINANDDAAIASDKLGFNGVGTATFANISSFSRGITGVMVDLQAGLGAHSLINLTSGDITFKVSPTAFVASTYNQLSTWTTAPTPANISVRLGAGTGGSDRIEITWPNGTIKNTWLEVDVHSGGHSGLSSDDIFFFGSLPGDSGVGDLVTLAKTDGNDYNATLSNIAGLTTPVWNALDYSKDGKVDGSDSNVSINNISSLRYIANLVTPSTPVVNLAGAATTSTSTWTHVGPVAVAGNAALAGGPGLAWLTVSLSSPRTGDILAANTTGTSITSAFINGSLMFTGSDTLAHYQQVLRSVTYDNISPTGPGANFETIQVTANDGTFSSPQTTATITIPPVLSLTGSSSTPNYTTNWYNSGSVPIVNMAQATAIDPAGVTNLASVTVKLTTFHTGDVLSVPTLGNTTIASSYANGTLTLSGIDSVADYQRTLRFINYNNTAGGPGTGSVTATLVASDGTYSSSPVTSTININVASGQVLGNRLFYNNSKYDGNNGAINANDDAAIASDKLGFNGVGTATFASISSYSRGITGVMVDLQAGLGAHSLINLTSGDIMFKVSPAAFVASTYNQLGTWTTAPTPANISVRLGAGTGGSDRIEITWPTGTIKNTWLAIDVHAGGNTGLSSDDIFYFGSVIGDSGAGDSATLAKSDGNDNTAAINNIVGLTTPVWNALDFSKDGKVDGSDANLPLSSVFALHYLANPTGSFGSQSESPGASPAAAPAAVVSSATPITTAVSTTDHVVDASLPSSLSLGAPLLTPNWIPGGPLHSTVVSAPDGRSSTHAASSRQFLEAIDQIARKFDATDESLDSLLAELGLR